MSAHVEPEWAMVTVMFVDIRGFTSYADRSTAREATDYLNEFFEVAIPVVPDHGGHVNKLLGDGLLAISARRNTFPTTPTRRSRPAGRCSTWSRRRWETAAGSASV